MKCSIEDCGRPRDSHGLCSTHLRRLKVHGNPLFGGPITKPGFAAEFLKRAIIHKGNDCLLWPYATTKEGYGHLTLMGRPSLAHRAVLKAWRRPPGDDYVAAHLCGNGHLGCVNPQHLTWVTQRENLDHRRLHGTARRITKGAAGFIARHGHQYSAEELASAFSLSVDFLLAWGAENSITFHAPDDSTALHTEGREVA